MKITSRFSANMNYIKNNMKSTPAVAEQVHVQLETSRTVWVSNNLLTKVQVSCHTFHCVRNIIFNYLFNVDENT